MNSVNQVELLGNIGRDVEVKTFTTKNGDAGSIFKFTVATSEITPAGREATSWHRIIAWNELADVCGNLAKGDTIRLVGKLKYGSYEKNGVKHYTTDIEAREIEILKKSKNATTQQLAASSTPVRDEVAELRRKLELAQAQLSSFAAGGIGVVPDVQSLESYVSEQAAS
jgi:single stranded DNA-binding protein